MADTEQTRLKYLQQAGVMYNTRPTEEFDAVVGLASSIIDMTIALVCLLYAEKVWFKAKWGFDFDHVPRLRSFCDFDVKNKMSCLMRER